VQTGQVKFIEKLYSKGYEESIESISILKRQLACARVDSFTVRLRFIGGF
jgi:hypothetical protein